MSRERVGEVYAEMAERCRELGLECRMAANAGDEEALLCRVRKLEGQARTLREVLDMRVRRLHDGKVGAGGNC